MVNTISKIGLLLAAFFMFTFSACQQQEDEGEVITRTKRAGSLEDSDKLPWVATTGMIGDALRELGRDVARVKVLMGPGVDPHLYKMTPADITYIKEAYFLCHNGLSLEGKMQDFIKDSWQERRTYAIVAGLNYNQLIPASSGRYEDTHDPHIWMDLSMWQKAVDSLSNVLMNQFPQQSDLIRANGFKYRSELIAVHDWATETLSKIPEDKRILITAHDAFQYFGRAYGLEVKGLQGMSTTAEYGIRDITDMVNFITEKRIPAIFIESSISPRAIESVIDGCKRKGHEVKLGGELYTDALGPKGSEAESFIGSFIHNVKTIYEALTGEEAPEFQTPPKA